MGTKDPANVEIELVLPLAAVSHRLSQLEGQLRLLNMKAVEFAAERQGGSLARLTEAHLEHIDEALEGIRKVLADMRSDTYDESGSDSRRRLRDKYGADRDD